MSTTSFLFTDIITSPPKKKVDSKATPVKSKATPVNSTFDPSSKESRRELACIFADISTVGLELDPKVSVTKLPAHFWVVSSIPLKCVVMTIFSKSWDSWCCFTCTSIVLFQFIAGATKWNKLCHVGSWQNYQKQESGTFCWEEW